MDSEKGFKVVLLGEAVNRYNNNNNNNTGVATENIG
ncbi:hypothetical protein PPL_03267 [Heterostelium album PN500]|uniref:Uncharacterized protein n=1 Tax=Heterostelium pallidum (strain ATCC 26659 / Pp 5 / PN500) TaxID=670386 RepID=D3B4E4_HETP5|nr:hypothetical protein PPL_03267 [Heterostelium album PN500]EFA84192.1 hypothetical protein PPL_03267 [Heterostelium album PN500]|eukprot:XP_020436309.1 hypothetical protein PPL_03267 [Heterostelium album PN500]